MNYIRRHWQGKLSLAVSFWINLVLINIAIQLIGILSSILPLDIHPKGAALAFLFLVFFWFFLLCPWQFVGIWRACRHHMEVTGNKFSARLTQALVVLIVMVFLTDLYRPLI